MVNTAPVDAILATPLPTTESPKEMSEAETESQRIDRLGRQRPEVFTSNVREMAFVGTILLSQFMVEYFVSGFNVILRTLVGALHIDASSVVWPSAAFALTTSAFLLPIGRVADIFGGYPVLVAGLAWFGIWSLITGFSQNELMLDICRALQGLGPAAILSSDIMLMGNIYRPGPRKNLVFSLWGGSAPLGFFFGIFIAGLTGEFLRFGWYFWIGAILIFVNVILAAFTVPNDMHERRKLGIKMDGIGSILIVSGLILFIFALTDGSHAPGTWKNPYILVTLILGIFLLGLAAWVELKVASLPLLPAEIFAVPYLKPLFIALFFSYGVFGTYLLYATLYMQNIMGATPLQVTAWYVPMAGGGIIISVVGGYVFDILSGTFLVFLSGIGLLVPSILFALAPVGANYWAFVFPSMIGATVSIDITFNIANIFITTNLSSKRQGLAGALANSLLYLGIAFCLAFADVTQTQTAHFGLQKSYHAVFWYQLGCAGLSLLIIIFFVRIKEAKSDLTVDEKEASKAEESQTAPRSNPSHLV